jgi:CBS-domain-containing membrane protein
MTPDVVDCFEDDDAGEVALKMEQHQIRRLIVLNRDRRLVGILSLGDLAVHTADDGLNGEVAEAVSEPAVNRHGMGTPDRLAIGPL